VVSARATYAGNGENSMKDLWLENLQKASAEGLPDYRAAAPSVQMEFLDLVRVDNGPDEADIPYAGDRIVQKARNDMFRKSSGVADERWDAPLGKAAAASFPERSKERFEKCAAAIKKVFGDTEEYDEAIAIARRVLNEARAEILVRASE
jgi:hypothetical protein